MMSRKMSVRSVMGLVAVAGLMLGAFEAGRRRPIAPRIQSIIIDTRDPQGTGDMRTYRFDLSNPGAELSMRRVEAQLKARGIKYTKALHR